MDGCVTESLYMSLQRDSVLFLYVTSSLLLSCLLKPKFHYADFHQNFPAGKVADAYHDLLTQAMTNHEIIKFR